MEALSRQLIDKCSSCSMPRLASAQQTSHGTDDFTPRQADRFFSSLAGTRSNMKGMDSVALTRWPGSTLRVAAIGFLVLLFASGTVSAAPATRLVVSECPRCAFVPPLCPTKFCLDASAVSGSAFPLTVAAIDAAGLVDTGYTGTVMFSSSDSSAILPPSFSFAPEDAGVAVINGFVLAQFGTQTITATDAGNPAISGTLQISVVATLASIPTTSEAARVSMAAALAVLGLWLSWRRSSAN
jgi:hypothetical protein